MPPLCSNFLQKNLRIDIFCHGFCSAKRLHQQTLNRGSLYGHNPNNTLVFFRKKNHAKLHVCIRFDRVIPLKKWYFDDMAYFLSLVFQMPCEDRCLDSLKPFCKGLCGFKHLHTHEVFGRHLVCMSHQNGPLAIFASMTTRTLIPRRFFFFASMDWLKVNIRVPGIN